MPHAPSLQVPRQRQPQREYEHARSPSLGYEDPTDAGLVRCLSHGFPTPLARWHYHDEYELHLITATSGKAFVGDWIGRFEPGHLVLCGPRLPHNWVSLDLPEGGVPERDMVIQFLHEPVAQAAQLIPELAEALPMLERARHGIEFFGMGERAQTHWHQTKAASGLARFAAFCEFLSVLARSTDYRLLSGAPMQGAQDGAGLDLINQVVDQITDDVSQAHSASDVARQLGMSESQFSRFFRRATGNNYSAFVNRVRVNRACQLLMDSDRLVSHICYEVGFNNVANFNRRFMEVKGVTPSDFRRQAAQRFSGGATKSH